MVKRRMVVGLSLADSLGYTNDVVLSSRGKCRGLPLIGSSGVAGGIVLDSEYEVRTWLASFFSRAGKFTSSK